MKTNAPFPWIVLLVLALGALLPFGGSVLAESVEPLDPDAWTLQVWTTKVDLLSVTFSGEAAGWIVGEKGTILHTSDGGVTWRSQTAPEKKELRGVVFIDAEHGWIVGGGNGMKRKAAPKVVHDPAETIPLRGGKIDLKEALKKARAKRKNWSFILRTEDGGFTWEKVQLDSNFPMWGVAMIDKDRGWITSGHAKEHPDGHYHFTEDGGKTWRRLTGPFHRPARPLYEITFVDENFGWAVGSHRRIGLVGEGTDEIVLYKNSKGGVIHTADGGKTWEVQDPGNAKDVYLLGLCFLDKDRGWVVGEKGCAYSTEDGGKTWLKQKTDVKVSLYAVDFLDAATGLIVGAKGTLLATNDGGKTWTPVKGKEKGDLLDVDFVSKTLAVAVGQGGAILTYRKK
ncbi:MAG: WD40/YVTN/BNR-like repeat-containing protein [Planctomycetota bacterium]